MKLIGFFTAWIAFGIPGAAAAQSATYTFPDWTLCLGECATSRLLALQPVEPVAPGFYIHQRAFDNPASARKNQVLNFGWNLAGGGGTAVAGEPATGYSFESFWSPTATTHWMEHHLFFVTAAGVQKRPFTWLFDRDTNWVGGGINADRFSFGHTSGLPPVFDVYATADGTGQIIMGTADNPFYFLANWNNRPLMYQLNAAGTGYVPLMQLDAKNRLQLMPRGQTASFGGKIQLGEGPTWQAGTGAPTCACSKGSLYSRTDEGPTLYVCEAADTWVAK